MTGTWYRDPTSEERTAHRGTVARGRVVTGCGRRTFPSYGARVEGEPAAEEICERCPRDATPEDFPAQGAAQVTAGQGAAPARGARTRWPVLVGPVGAALAGAVLLVAALALVVHLAWPR